MTGCILVQFENLHPAFLTENLAEIEEPDVAVRDVAATLISLHFLDATVFDPHADERLPLGEQPRHGYAS